MLPDSKTCYRAMRERDARLDGCFFVGVSSTRIYCRPVCRVKAPKPENCTFFATAAAAEAAGYRPCLRCRPELAPGNVRFEAGDRLAQSAASLIEEGLMNGSGVEGLAERLGVTSSHLQKTFNDEFGVTPIDFAQTQRLLLAKRLLTDSALSVTDVALVAGFLNVRRFNTVFQERYRLEAKQVRKSTQLDRRPDAVRCDLSYRPPHDWKALIAFLGARSISGVEAVDEGSYRRIVRISQNGQAHKGWVEIAPDPAKNALRALVSSSLLKVLPAVLSRARHLMDLGGHPAEVSRVLGKLAEAHPGMRVPGAFDGFEIAVRAILGQQISVAAARTLAGRIATAFGVPVASPFEELRTAFPVPEEIARLDSAEIARLGVLPTRARTIRDLAQALADGVITLKPGADVPAAMQALRSIRGIGEWTAQYIALRALAWPDAFPHTDLGIFKALGERNPKKVLAAGEAWRPWRAYAVMHLWAGSAHYSREGS